MKLSNLQKQASSLGQRYYTLELIFSLLAGLRSRTMVQVGCQSKDFEYASFDLFKIFADFTLNNPELYYTIYTELNDDQLTNRIHNIKSSIYKDYNSEQISIKDIKESEGIKYNIDLLILNDICYPINEITELTSKDLNYLESRNLLNSYTEQEIEEYYGDIIYPCQKKVLDDFNLFKSNLSRSAIVLLEGNDYPGGSQTSLVKRDLKNNGFICLLDLKQSVWIRR